MLAMAPSSFPIPDWFGIRSTLASRAEEIRAWLKEYYQLVMGSHNKASGGDCQDTLTEEHGVRFVILDDRLTAADDSEFMQRRFVHCDTTQGINEENVDRAI